MIPSRGSLSRALAVFQGRSDSGFFTDHADRKAHIRRPYKGECEGEFWSLGEHDRNRRRIILWRVPDDNPMLPADWRKTNQVPLLKIPFLAFADESIEDSDAVLMPIVHQIMTDAAARLVDA